MMHFAIKLGLIFLSATVAQTVTAQDVSYDKQVRPIFQARCHGCHQPAKDKGGFEMTNFQRLLAGGKSKDVAIVPGDPGTRR